MAVSEKCGSVFDFVLDLSTMIIASKDIAQDNRSCSICAEEYSESGTEERVPIKLRCGHIFDMSCLLKWLSIHEPGSNRNACPMCRTPLFKLDPPAQRIDVEYLRCLVAQAEKDQWLRDECTAGLSAYIMLFMLSVISFFSLFLDPTPLRIGMQGTLIVLSVVMVLCAWMIAKAGEVRGETKW